MLNISSYSLDPVQGELNKQDLLHLLRRTLFGVGHIELDFFKGKNIQECLDVLLVQTPAAAPPVENDPDHDDPLLPKGAVWIDAPYEDEDVDKRRRIELKGWWTEKMINRDSSLTEKMVLFWHNHFVTEIEVVKDARYSYRYLAMLRKHALGNFKELIREGATNPAMLVYLNGNTNTQTAPNENFSRELMELFTLGKGDQATFTEDDVRAAAHVFSGWRDNKNTFKPHFDPHLHDQGDKKFSSFFSSKIIKGRSGGQGAIEKDELIDIIFDKKETARFFCRNIYRWFVFANIDSETENKIIDPLADYLIANDYSISAALRLLLSSQHFFDPAIRGRIVKSPVDFLIGTTKHFDIPLPKDQVNAPLCWVGYNYALEDMSLVLGDPPSVAGWPAYYQAPKFHQWWMNSHTLLYRMKLTNSLCSDAGYNFNGPKIKIDIPRFMAGFDKGIGIDDFADQCLDLLLAVKIDEQVKENLKHQLASGMDAQGSRGEIWSQDQSTKNDKSKVEKSIKLFLKTIMSMPEYQMI